jgi:hypothetical protein
MNGQSCGGIGGELTSATASESTRSYIPDWLLGGNRKQLLLAELVENPNALGARGLALE